MQADEREIKGVIFAAGYGTRFLPASKTVPKELFPLIDVPAIDFVIKEFLKSGIEDILVVTSRRKKVLEDYLDHEMELEMILEREGSNTKLAKITPDKRAHFHFVRQWHMRGTADALNMCRPFCGNSPFVVAYPDDLILDAPTPCSAQLIDAYRRTGDTVLATRNLAGEDVSRYGVIDCQPGHDGVHKVKRLVEKPPQGSEPSSIVSFGRYLYTPEIFRALDRTEFVEGGETSQSEPINMLASEGLVSALEFEGERFDVGEPFGYLQTIVEYALTRSDIAPKFRDYLRANQDRLLGG
jgi:UTP--glucose-1-phosphate uridylyltransferase